MGTMLPNLDMTPTWNLCNLVLDSSLEDGWWEQFPPQDTEHPLGFDGIEFRQCPVWCVVATVVPWTVERLDEFKAATGLTFFVDCPEDAIGWLVSGPAVGNPLSPLHHDPHHQRPNDR